MANLVKRTEDQKVFYLIPLTTKLFGQTAYLDASSALRGANRRDKQKGYPYEQGPNFAFEVTKADEYARFVEQYATPENLHKFNKSGYYFFINQND